MVIRVVNLSTAADTESHGAVLYVRLCDALKSDNVVTVSFAGIHTATSSFVNAGFVPLMQHYSFADIKRRLRIVDSTRQINDMIRSRLEREALVLA